MPHPEGLPPSPNAQRQELPGEQQRQLPGREQRLIGDGRGRNKFRVAVVETSESIEKKARDLADLELTRNKNELKSVGGFFAKVWKHNLFKEYYRQKGIRHAKESIGVGDKANLYAEDATGGAVKHEMSMNAIASRFASELGNEDVLHEGEDRKDLQDTPEQVQIRRDMQKLVTDFATNPAMDRATFDAEKYRIFSRLRKERQDIFDTGKLYADNLTQVAEAVRAAVQQGQSIEQLDIDLDVVIGKAKAGVRTEAHFNTVDKIVDKIQKLPLGKFVANEAAVSFGVSIAHSLGAIGIRRALGSRLAMVASFGGTALLGGGVAALREAKMMEDDRRQHYREMAQGKKFNPAESPRRNELEALRYKTRPATELISNLREAMAGDMNDTKAMSAMAELADVEARIDYSDEKQIDLIAHTSEELVDQEQKDLFILRGTLKKRLQDYADSAAGTGFKASLGGMNVRQFVTTQSISEIVSFESGADGVTAKDQAFSKLKRNSALKAAGKGMAIGLATSMTFGALMQEWFSHAGSGDPTRNLGFLGRGIRPDQEGVFSPNETVPIGKGHYTYLEAIKRLFSGEWPQPSLPSHDVVIGSNTFKLPEGMDLIDRHDGTFNLTANGVPIKEGLTFGPDGSFTPISRQAFADLDIKAIDQVAHGVKHVAGHETPAQYLNAHHPGTPPTHNISRVWQDNDTPAPNFESVNEQRLWWGGVNDTGIDAKGNYVMNISHMVKGSFHQGFSPDAQKIFQDGHMKLLLSLSKDTQNQVFEVDFDATGNAIIDPNSEIGKLMFHTVNGKAEFIGKYAEVGNLLKVVKDSNGNSRELMDIFATHTGDGRDSIDTVVDEITNKHITTVEVPVRSDFELPYAIVGGPRTPLERLSRPDQQPVRVPQGTPPRRLEQAVENPAPPARVLPRNARARLERPPTPRALKSPERVSPKLKLNEFMRQFDGELSLAAIEAKVKLWPARGVNVEGGDDGKDVMVSRAGMLRNLKALRDGDLTNASGVSAIEPFRRLIQQALDKKPVDAGPKAGGKVESEVKKLENIENRTEPLVIKRGEKIEVTGNVKLSEIIIEDGAELIIKGRVSDSALIRVKKGGKVKIENIEDSILVAEKGASLELNKVKNLILYRDESVKIKAGTASDPNSRRANRVKQTVISGTIDSKVYNLIKNKRDRVALVRAHKLLGESEFSG